MKTIVVYQSSTGFTQQYAQWIGEKCSCRAAEIGKVTKEELSRYDRVTYGGWIMGNMIMGLDKVRKLSPKELVVFSVGATPADEGIENRIKEQNHLENIPFFYFEGGFHFDKLSFPKRTVLKMLKKSLSKKENRTRQENYMLETLGTSVNHSDMKYIGPLIAFVTGGQ